MSLDKLRDTSKKAQQGFRQIAEGFELLRGATDLLGGAPGVDITALAGETENLYDGMQTLREQFQAELRIAILKFKLDQTRQRHS
jgi:hypothetical protein